MSANDRDLLFKTLNKSSLDEILGIENDVHLSPWSEQKFLTCFTDDLYLQKGLYEKNSLVGYAVLLVNPPEAELHNIAISRAYQNRGLGTIFLNYLVDICANMGLEKIFLEVGESNTAAIGVYQKSGFIQVGIRKHYYQSETLTESALLFMLEID